MATTNQIGGLASFAVDGIRYIVVEGGDVTYSTRATKATSIVGVTGYAGYSEEAVACFVETEIYCSGSQFDTLAGKRAATVIASTAGGTSVKGSNLAFVADPSHAVNAGRATVRFEGAKVDV